MSGKPSWGEADSRDFIGQGDAFVPDRETQLRILCDLVPAPDGPFEVVDLGCGAGLLTAAVLERYPHARVQAVDASAAMLEAARQTNARHGERVSFTRQSLESWSPSASPPPVAVLTSLALHHLEDEAKRALFGRTAAGLLPGGTLLIADLVAPRRAAGRALAAAMWDEAVALRSMERHGAPRALEAFRSLGWNMYALEAPDPEDRPAPLLSQLDWLREAGFEGVDVFWMCAGHAIFGGHAAASDS